MLKGNGFKRIQLLRNIHLAIINVLLLFEWRKKMYSWKQMQLRAVVMVTIAVSLPIFLLYCLGGIKIFCSTACDSGDGKLGQPPLPSKLMWILVMCLKLLFLPQGIEWILWLKMPRTDRYWFSSISDIHKGSPRKSAQFFAFHSLMHDINVAFNNRMWCWDDKQCTGSSTVFTK